MTPAEIAARAAAVAAEWTPERYTAWRLDLCDALDRRKYTSAALVAQKAADAIGALLADRERLRGLVAAAHIVQAADVLADDGEAATWRITCTAPDCDWETEFTGSGPELVNSIHVIGAAHVAAILDGGGA